MEVDICGDATLWSWLRVHMHRILNQDLLLLLDTPPLCVIARKTVARDYIGLCWRHNLGSLTALPAALELHCRERMRHISTRTNDWNIHFKKGMIPLVLP